MSSVGTRCRRPQIWAKWREHVEQQRECGQSQVEYCRALDLEPKYFSLRKSKLAKAAARSTTPDSPRTPLVRLVLVVVTPSGAT